jgi:hypothetical protein
MRLARAFLAMERSLTPLDGAPAHARGSGYPPDKGSNPVSRDLAAGACGKLTARQLRGERRAPAQVSPFRQQRGGSWEADSAPHENWL